VGILCGCSGLGWVDDHFKSRQINDMDELTSRNEISSRISTTSRAFSFFSSFESFGGMVGGCMGLFDEELKLVFKYRGNYSVIIKELDR
jgi:hypothetical protein